jgi:collagenase-like PrtC family protease
MPAPSFVAPVSSPEEARRAIAAGASELYCGVLTGEWVKRFGDGETISRRQGRLAHVRGMDELAEIARLGAHAGCTVALTLNSRQASIGDPEELRLAGLWEEMGGTAVMVADLGLLLALRERNSRLKRHLSVLAGVFNSRSAEFFAELGVARIVLPRELTIAEMRELAAGAPALQYEALVIYQKCRFIDGMCGFHHGARLPSDVPAAFEYSAVAGESMPVVWSCDPDYEGHACQLGWTTGHGLIMPSTGDDTAAPWCAACHLEALQEAGVHFFKLAGRGYPVELIESAIGFLRRAGNRQGDTAEIRRLYAETFGSRCEGSRCYYAGAS